MASRTRTVATGEVETDKAEELTTEAENTLEMANTDAREGTFIYIGPTLRTGARENAMFKGTREQVENYLKPTIDKYPQVRLLLVPTERLAEMKTKVKTTGTLLNKYYTDILSLSVKQ